MSIPTLTGLPEHERPVVDIHGSMSYWSMRWKVNATLNYYGKIAAAREFRYLAEHECDHDVGMLMTLALNYIRVPGQEPATDDSTRDESPD